MSSEYHNAADDDSEMEDAIETTQAEVEDAIETEVEVAQSVYSPGVLALHQRYWRAILERMKRDGVTMKTFTTTTETMYKFHTAEKKTSCVQHVDFAAKVTKTLFTTNDVCKLDNFSKFRPLGGERTIAVENLTFCGGKLALEWVGMKMYAENRQGVRDKIHKYAVDALEADIARLVVLEGQEENIKRLQRDLARFKSYERLQAEDVLRGELRAEGGRMFSGLAKAIKKQMDECTTANDHAAFSKWARHLDAVEGARGAFEQAMAPDGCTAAEIVEAVRLYRWEALQPVLADLRPGTAKVQVGRNVLYYFIRFAWEGLDLGTWTVTLARKHLMLLEPEVAYFTHAMTFEGRAAEYSFTDEIWALKPPVGEDANNNSSLDAVDDATWPLFSAQIEMSSPRKLEVANTRAVDWLNVWGVSLGERQPIPLLGEPAAATEWLALSGWEPWMRGAAVSKEDAAAYADAPYDDNDQLRLLIQTSTFETSAAMLIFFGEQWDTTAGCV